MRSRAKALKRASENLTRNIQCFSPYYQEVLIYFIKQIVYIVAKAPSCR